MTRVKQFEDMSTEAATTTGAAGHKKLCRVAKGYIGPTHAERIFTGPLLHHTLSDNTLQRPIYAACRSLGDESIVRICATSSSPLSNSEVSSSSDTERRSIHENISSSNSDPCTNNEYKTRCIKKVLFDDTVTVHVLSDDEDSGISASRDDDDEYGDDDYPDDDREFLSSQIRNYLKRNACHYTSRTRQDCRYPVSEETISSNSASDWSAVPALSSNNPSDWPTVTALPSNNPSHWPTVTTISSNNPSDWSSLRTITSNNASNSPSVTTVVSNNNFDSSSVKLTSAKNSFCQAPISTSAIQHYSDFPPKILSSTERDSDWSRNTKPSTNHEADVPLRDDYHYYLQHQSAESTNDASIRYPRGKILDTSPDNVSREQSFRATEEDKYNRDIPDISIPVKPINSLVVAASYANITPHVSYRTQINCVTDDWTGENPILRNGNVAHANTPGKRALSRTASTHLEDSSCANSSDMNIVKTVTHESQGTVEDNWNTAARCNDAKLSLYLNGKLTPQSAIEPNIDRSELSRSIKVFVELGMTFSPQNLAIIVSDDGKCITVLLANNHITDPAASAYSNTDSMNVVKCNDNTILQKIPPLPEGYSILNNLRDSEYTRQNYSPLQEMCLPQKIDSNNTIAILDVQGYLLIDAPICL